MAFAQATMSDGMSAAPDVADQPPLKAATEPAAEAAPDVPKAGTEAAKAAPAAPGAAAPGSASPEAIASEAAAVAQETVPAMAQPSASIEAPPPPPPPPIEVDVTVVAPAAVPAPASTPSATEQPAVDAAPVMADGPPEPEKREPVGAEPSKPTPPRTRNSEPTKRVGQVAVFVSKQEQKIFVRQGFVPVFEMPVEIADPDRPLGTHVFTALEVQDGSWNAISMPPERPRAASKKPGKKSAPPAASPAELKAPSTAGQALDRIKLPAEAIERIGELLVPGSSLVVSDHGLGRETGRYTEFIVVTRH
jgi:hypothetical protein